MKVLCIADPIASLDAPNDTTLCFLNEGHWRGYEIFIHEMPTGSCQDPQAYLQSLDCRKLKNPKDNNWLAAQKMPADAFEMIFHRKDPPVDARYVTHTEAFATLDQSIPQINNPSLIGRLSEKQIPLDYPGMAIPTQIFKEPGPLLDFLREQEGEWVLKPDNLFSGRGIIFVDKMWTSQKAQEYFKEYGPTILCQPFREVAQSLGDLRVLCFGGRILGAFLRKAAPGKRLQNLHQGGSAHKFKVTPSQIECIEKISRDLSDKGIHFVGYDFLGDELSEVNITSPMGLIQINQLYGVRSQERFWDCVEETFN